MNFTLGSLYFISPSCRPDFIYLQYLQISFASHFRWANTVLVLILKYKEYIIQFCYKNHNCLQIKYLLDPRIKPDSCLCLPSLCFFPSTHPSVRDLVLSPTSVCLGKLLHVLMGQQAAFSLEQAKKGFKLSFPWWGHCWLSFLSLAASFHRTCQDILSLRHLFLSVKRA